MPKRKPPSGGPARLTSDVRAVCAPTASGSCRAGTTARSAPTAAAVKTTEPIPSTSAAARIAQNGGWPATITTVSTTRATPRSASAAIMSRRRSNRSAASPAGMKSSA